MLGLSILGWVKHILAGWGAPWYLLLIVPIVVVTAFARKEEEWLPDPELRIRCARWLILGSIAIMMLSSVFMPRPSAPSKAKSEPQGRARIENR